MKVQHRFNVDGNASASATATATATATAAANATAAASAVAANPFDPNKNHNHCHTSTFFNHHESASSYCPRVVSCDSSLEQQEQEQEQENSNHLTPRPSSTLTILNHLTSPPERNFHGNFPANANANANAGPRGPVTKYSPVTNIGANTSVLYSSSSASSAVQEEELAFQDLTRSIDERSALLSDDDDDGDSMFFLGLPFDHIPGTGTGTGTGTGANRSGVSSLRSSAASMSSDATDAEFFEATMNANTAHAMQDRNFNRNRNGNRNRNSMIERSNPDYEPELLSTRYFLPIRPRLRSDESAEFEDVFGLADLNQALYDDFSYGNLNDGKNKRCHMDSDSDTTCSIDIDGSTHPADADADIDIDIDIGIDPSMVETNLDQQEPDGDILLPDSSIATIIMHPLDCSKSFKAKINSKSNAPALPSFSFLRPSKKLRTVSIDQDSIDTHYALLSSITATRTPQVHNQSIHNNQGHHMQGSTPVFTSTSTTKRASYDNANGHTHRHTTGIAIATASIQVATKIHAPVPIRLQGYSHDHYRYHQQTHHRSPAPAATRATSTSTATHHDHDHDHHDHTSYLNNFGYSNYHNLVHSIHCNSPLDKRD
jgi:hypothetical protein